MAASNCLTGKNGSAHRCNGLSTKRGPAWLTLGIAVCPVFIPIAAGATPASSGGYTPTTALGSIGLTENQQRTGDGVNTLCLDLSGRDGLTGDQSDLLTACTAMVVNALELGGADVNGGLGLDQEGLAAAVQTVANEELAATKSMATEFTSRQTYAGIARLNAIRGTPQIAAAALFNPFADLAATTSDTGSDRPITGGGAGDALIGSWGLFANASYGIGDRKTTDNEDGFDYDTWGVNLGGDYRFNDRTIVGAILSYGSSEVDFDQSPAVPGGGIDADSWGISLYGTYYTDKYYVDGLIGYTRTDYDISRRVLLPGLLSRTATADTEGDGFTASVGGGMDLHYRGFDYGPYARLSYDKSDVDGYTETGAVGLNITADNQDWESLTSVIGIRGSRSMSMGWGVLAPQLRLGWVHEYLNGSETSTAFYVADPLKNAQTALTTVSDDPDRNYVELGLGVSAVMQDGLQAFFDYQTLLAHKAISDHSFTIGVRKEF